MIKNCVNTFFSSVFRVLGRFLAYAIVGIVFYLLAGYLGLLSVQAKEIDVSGQYGIYRAQYKNRNGVITVISPAQYVSSNSVAGDSTSYTFFPPRESLITPSVTQYNYYVMPEFRVFANATFKAGSFYTLNCKYGVGGEFQLSFQNGLLSSSVGGLMSGSSDYDTSLVSNVSVSYSDQYFTVTFKALQDFGSVRFRFGNQELFSNNQYTTLLLSNNSDYNQGFRIYVLNLVEADDLNSALLGQITNQNETIINQNQQIIDKQQEIVDSNKDINDTLKNEDISDIDFSLSGIVQSSDTPVSDMVLLPITLLNKLNDNTSSACSSWFMPFDFTGGNNVLKLPCIKLEKYLGSDLVGIIDDLICIFMTWSIIMSFVSFFNDITGLRDTYDSMYQPKHSYTGYKPKHGKE